MVSENAQTSTSSGIQVTQTVDLNHPLHLHTSYLSGVSLISLQLTGTENYSIWSRFMRIALLRRNKLGFIDGTCKKEKFGEELWAQWGRANDVVLSWLMKVVSNSLLSGIVYASNAYVVWEELKERFDKVNGARTFNLHKEITSLTQGTSSVSTYFTKLKGLWNELKSLVPTLGCECEKSRDFLIYL
ncbi:hypothetical protein KY290_005396 [Solanum tuberosum]|uniref:Retrotransposon Copia-like N-terminal domain-containing protein n=1 Tax=Solanum tuberosum TaxID=4113 RepID=A0ABQ7WE18_SOLTU|nr:hypothetical protein KY289_005792 [Solanum tuberosum]KAH0778969.1 hypothetical protein KY290_005396 [Solanum tuberosum]